MDEDEDDSNNIIPDAQQLQDLISKAENGDAQGYLPLAKAAALVTAEEFIKMYATYCWCNHWDGGLIHF